MLMGKIQERNHLIKKLIVEGDDEEEEDESGSGSGTAGNFFLQIIVEHRSFVCLTLQL